MLSISQPVAHKRYEPVNAILEIFKQELKAQELLNRDGFVRVDNALNKHLQPRVWLGASPAPDQFRPITRYTDFRTRNVAVNEMSNRKIDQQSRVHLNTS